jgi:hypothetical protein
MEPNSHHLVMGQLTDFLTGRCIADTHDERYHQKLARHLVETLGYTREQIRQKQTVEIPSGSQIARVTVDFLVGCGSRVDMLIKYAPGSLVTRRLSNLALSRMIQPVYIPIVVTTNGEDAEVVSGLTGKVLAEGIQAIPGPEDSFMTQIPDPPVTIPEGIVEKAVRIAYACEVEGSCLMDNDFKCDTWYCYPDRTQDKP